MPPRDERYWEKEFAYYAACLFRIGSHTNAALVASIMFEKAVYRRLQDEFDISKQTIRIEARNRNEGDLQWAITRLAEELKNPGLKNILNEIRINTRNKIIHELRLEEIKPNDIRQLVVKTWEMLDTERERFQDLDQINFLEADYKVVGMSELFNSNVADVKARHQSFNMLEKSDFEELYLLREKMLSLKEKIQKEVLDKKYPDIYINILSKVDTTSAYVWMAMCLHTDGNVRKRIESASASFLATPLDFRIYFDIGGGAYEVREDYYKFLDSDSCKKFLSCEYIDPELLNELIFFDNDWYCFVIDKQPLSIIGSAEYQCKLQEATQRLESYKDEIITWNRMLLGFMIPRGDISYEMITERLEVIVRFYYCFENFRQRELGRHQNYSFKVDVKQICTPVKPKQYTMQVINKIKKR